MDKKLGKEKQEAYSIEYTHFKKALKEEFYLEAVAIGYAIIEDRFNAFFHYAGIITRENSNLCVNRCIYPYLRFLLKKDSKYSIRIKNISVKMQLIKALISMSEEQASQIDNDVGLYVKTLKKKRSIAKHGYMVDLFKQIGCIDKSKITSLLDRIDPWRANRNRLIHALLNMTVDVASDIKVKCANESYSITREIDYFLVKPFKENNKLRKDYNIQ